MNLRDYEKESIRAFVQAAADEGYLSGRVLDYGCGRQPYREIVEETATMYLPYDERDFPGNTSGANVGKAVLGADSILCTQVLQYVPEPLELLYRFMGTLHHPALSPGPKYLTLTYPLAWPEIEKEDLHRFTKAGMERLLTEAGFEVVRHEPRGVLHDPTFSSGRSKRITATGEEFAIGYGVIARA